jgi:exopolyphosphatase/guanosine-5'-triphosphate,3'-diphosphate pyrophosphatase
MFDELARLRVHDGDERERELLWAASMLHDIGMSIDYDDHHKHSRYLILSAGLPGFEPVEVAIIAQAARYHRKGMPTPGPLASLFGDGDASRLERCAVLLRLAEDLERSRDQLVRAARFEQPPANGTNANGNADAAAAARANGSGELALRLISEGESAVPRWAAARETELFARAFGRRLSLVG